MKMVENIPSISLDADYSGNLNRGQTIGYSEAFVLSLSKDQVPVTGFRLSPE